MLPSAIRSRRPGSGPGVGGAAAARRREQRAGDLAQPVRGLAEALHHRRVGQVRQAMDPGPGRRRAQRQPARAVGQRQPQQHLGAAYGAAPHQCPARPGRRLQVDRGRDHRDQVGPLRVERGGCGLHPHLESRAIHRLTPKVRAYGALPRTEADQADGQLAAAMQRIGELSMEVELLRARIARPGPLARRRSR
jgi:hypothetical protein